MTEGEGFVCGKCGEPGVMLETTTHGQFRKRQSGEPAYEKQCFYYLDDNCLQGVVVAHGRVVAHWVPGHWQNVNAHV